MNLPEIFMGVPWAVVGGVATRSYMPERFTKDADVLVPDDWYDRSGERLRESGWKNQSALAFAGSALGLRGGLWIRGDGQIDLLTSGQAWAAEACAGARDDKTGLRVVALPYLVLMKLDSGRAQDTADVTRMLALADDAEAARAREVVRLYARDDEVLEDFDSLLQIGRWELGRDR